MDDPPIIHKESIYDHPKYYDLVFGADCAAETHFIVECSEQFLNTDDASFFEPACGTGRLIMALAKQGYAVAGIDLNEKAIAFCNDRMQRHGIEPTAFTADMTDFNVSRSYDVAFNTINSFRHLCSETAARKHFHCMANVIREGGLYLLGLHLSPTLVDAVDTESWSARRGHLAINTHMWTKHRNPVKRLDTYGIQFDVHKPSGAFRILDELVMRSYTAKQMDRLIRSTKHWEIEATYDFSYDLSSPIAVDETCEDVVYVLRRVGSH